MAVQSFDATADSFPEIKRAARVYSARCPTSISRRCGDPARPVFSASFGGDLRKGPAGGATIDANGQIYHYQRTEAARSTKGTAHGRPIAETESFRYSQARREEADRLGVHPLEIEFAPFGPAWEREQEERRRAVRMTTEHNPFWASCPSWTPPT